MSSIIHDSEINVGVSKPIEFSLVADDMVTVYQGDVTTLRALAEVVCSMSWSPFIFKDNRRNKANFSYTSLLVLDIDDSPDPDDATFIQRFSKYRCIISKTRSDGLLKNGKVSHRYRVILFSNERISDSSVYQATYAKLLELFPFADFQVKDEARFYYASKQVVHIQESGELISPETPTILPAKENPPSLSTSPLLDSTTRGMLAKSTKDFLVNGAPAGQWNSRLFKAAVDANEQNIPQAEFVASVSNMAPYGFLDGHDLATIKSAYERKPKYEPRLLEKMVNPLLGKNSNFELSNLTENSDLIEDDSVLNASGFFTKLSSARKYLVEPENFTPWKTGIDELDRRLGGGLFKNTLTAVTAPGKTGKTTFLVQLTANLAKLGTKVCWLSLEMSPERHIFPSLLSVAYETNIRQLLKHDIDEAKRMIDDAKELHPWLANVSFFNRMGMTPSKTIEQFIERNPADVYIIDHVGYSLSSIQDFESHSKLAKALRKLTDKLPIHILAVVQPRNPSFGEKISKFTLYGGAVWSQDVNQLLVLERGENNQTKVYVTDSHNPLALTSDKDFVLMQYDRTTGILKD